MDSPTPPKAPDPAKVAAAQTQSNLQTAQAQQQLGMVDQYTPYGSLTYTQTGNWGNPATAGAGAGVSNFGGGGMGNLFGLSGGGGGGVGGALSSIFGGGSNSPGLPHYTATQTLSPAQQQLLDYSNAIKSSLGAAGADQAAKMRDIYNTPFDLNSAASTQWSDMATKLLDPVWKQRENDLRSQLLNQGIAQNSDQYNNAYRDFGDLRNRAYDEAQLGGRQEAVNEALTQRNQPINEIAALLGGSGATNPNFVNTPAPGVQPTNVSGIYNDNYNQQMAAYNAQMGQNNAMMGGLFGLGGTALAGGLKYGLPLMMA